MLGFREPRRGHSTGPGRRRIFWPVATVGGTYRNRLLLVPHDHDVRADGCAPPDVDALCASGWELISSGVTEDGDDLLMFRHPHPAP